MQESPETPESEREADDRAPLGVRVIAGLILLLSCYSVIKQALSLWTEEWPCWSVWFVLLPIAWGLLRRREWARVAGSMMSLMVLLVWLIGLPAWVMVLDGMRRYYSVLRCYVGLVPWLLVALLLYWVFRSLELGPARAWFRNATSRPPFLVWNPLKWRFSVGTMLLLTAMFALSTYQIAYHPRWPELWGQRWVERQSLSDPIYFPHGVRFWPRTSDGVQGQSWELPTGDQVNIWYAMQAPRDWREEPRVIFVQFLRGNVRWNPQPKRVEPWFSHRYHYELPLEGESKAMLPDDVQIFEVVDGELLTSDLRITVLELWSYINQPDGEWTIEGLESYVKDLRERVAERDAKSQE